MQPHVLRGSARSNLWHLLTEYLENGYMIWQCIRLPVMQLKSHSNVQLELPCIDYYYFSLD